MSDFRETSSLKVTLVHGTRQYKLELKEYGGEITLAQLIKAVEEATEIPQSHQKLIYRGKTLTNLSPHEILVNHGLKNGARVMLMGHKPIPDDKQDCDKMMDIAKSIDVQSHKMDELVYEMEGIAGGFLVQSLHQTALRKILKRIAGFTEYFMRQLEEIDGLQLLPENHKARVSRKVVVSRIQDHLTKCDEMKKTADELLQKIEASLK